MTRQILKYLMAGILTAATTGIAAAQSISLGHTTPAASTAHAGGLSYTYSIGRIARMVTTTIPADSRDGNTKATSSTKAIAATAYPNPCTTLLHVKADEPISGTNAKIQIIDSKGGVAATMETSSASDDGEISIDMSHFAQGKYIIKITNANGTYTATAIKF